MGRLHTENSLKGGQGALKRRALTQQPAVRRGVVAAELSQFGHGGLISRQMTSAHVQFWNEEFSHCCDLLVSFPHTYSASFGEGVGQTQNPFCREVVLC